MSSIYLYLCKVERLVENAKRKTTHKMTVTEKSRLEFQSLN